MCYNCRRPRHISKELLGIGPLCLCCKAIGHEVEDFPRMIAKVENMNMREENYKEGHETKDMLKNHTEKESEAMLMQLNEEMDDHREISLPEILKEKTMHSYKNRRLRHRLCIR
jgi:hypothetical protein